MKIINYLFSMVAVKQELLPFLLTMKIWKD